MHDVAVPLHLHQLLHLDAARLGYLQAQDCRAAFATASEVGFAGRALWAGALEIPRDTVEARSRPRRFRFGARAAGTRASAAAAAADDSPCPRRCGPGPQA